MPIKPKDDSETGELLFDDRPEGFAGFRYLSLGCADEAFDATVNPAENDGPRPGSCGNGVCPWSESTAGFPDTDDAGKDFSRRFDLGAITAPPRGGGEPAELDGVTERDGLPGSWSVWLSRVLLGARILCL